MFGVAAAHILSDELISAAPKAGEVFCYLNRSHRRREQRHHNADFAVHDFGGFEQPEALLQFDFYGRLVAVIMNQHPAA